MEKYFDILGLSYSASTAEIRVAYKDLVKKWHPDMFPDSSEEEKSRVTEKCKEINNAYDFLIQYHADNKPKAEKTETEEFVWKKVTSSNLHSVGYNETNKTLRIIFKNGGKYEYADVPKSVYSQLMSASSKGKFANDKICYKYKYRNF